VNGAAPTHNAALASLGSEIRLTNGVSLLSNRSRTYAGTGAVRFMW
jgi:hypothetical protein